MRAWRNPEVVILEHPITRKRIAVSPDDAVKILEGRRWPLVPQGLRRAALALVGLLAALGAGWWW